MRILSIGTFSSYGISNTCLHRNWVLEKLATTESIDSTYNKWVLTRRIINFLFVKFRLPVNFAYKEINKKIKEKIDNNCYDIIWIDKGIQINPCLLKRIKKNHPKTLIVGYSPDNMSKRHNQSFFFLKGIKYYDYYITTKSYIVDDLYSMGVSNVIFVNNAYEETFHHPYNLSNEEKIKLGGTVGFIGSWEKDRCEYIVYLADNGIPIKIWGGGKWLKYRNHKNLIIESKGLFSEEYNKALSAFDISLCFLRKMNHDLQTTRTMEIPACGSLLLAERTKEHKELFEEDVEAVFFSSKSELLEKCSYLLNNPKKIKEIATAGRLRCIKSGYSNYNVLKGVLQHIQKDLEE